jgi:hypothetical protein
MIARQVLYLLGQAPSSRACFLRVSSRAVCFHSYMDVHGGSPVHGPCHGFCLGTVDGGETHCPAVTMPPRVGPVWLYPATKYSQTL